MDNFVPAPPPLPMPTAAARVGFKKTIKHDESPKGAVQ